MRALPWRRVPRPKSAFSRLLDHFHTHPRGRLHEMLFWNGVGLLAGGLTYLSYVMDWLSLPLALIAAIVALCLFLWGFLPQKKAPPPKALPGRKRAEIAKAVKEGKKERRRGPRPPTG
jgi:hypothetical protein